MYIAHGLCIAVRLSRTSPTPRARSQIPACFSPSECPSCRSMAHVRGIDANTTACPSVGRAVQLAACTTACNTIVTYGARKTTALGRGWMDDLLRAARVPIYWLLAFLLEVISPPIASTSACFPPHHQLILSRIMDGKGAGETRWIGHPSWRLSRGQSLRNCCCTTHIWWRETVSYAANARVASS